jgi:[glutamine synthetase] adenylyltransferase / [glutamine synthetase]-adenylyl-L-tyrosine phosphorylase
MKSASQLTPWGRLFHVDVALRSTSGNLAVSSAELQSHFAAGGTSFSDWHSLLRSRPILADGDFDQVVTSLVRALFGPSAAESATEAVRFARYGKEESASQWNVKRAPGGWLDIEFLASYLTLQSSDARAAVNQANSTVALLNALEATKQLADDDAQTLSANYRWLRQVDSALRLLAAEPRHDLPEDPVNLGKLALLLRCESGDELRQRTLDAMDDTRRRFERILGERAPADEESATVAEPNTAS